MVIGAKYEEEGRSIQFKNNKKLLNWWQWRIFVILFISYISCYFGRQIFSSLSHWAIISDVNIQEVGLISSGFACGFSIGKLTGAFIVDIFPPQLTFPFIIFFVGFCNLFFSLVPSFYFLIFFWFINGILQGMAWVY